MTHFLRLLAESDKANALSTACAQFKLGVSGAHHFDIPPSSFDPIPGKPFAYWVSDAVRQIFQRLPEFQSGRRSVKQGLATADDFRFVRASWEIDPYSAASKWYPFAKGGSYSPWYSDLHLVVNWGEDGKEMKAWADPLYGNSGWSRILKSTEYYLHPGLTWPLRTNGLSFRIMPVGCLFGHKGPAAFAADDDQDQLLAHLCIANSRGFGLLVSVQLARTELAQSFEVGLIQQTPVPELTPEQRDLLSGLARRAWSLKRSLDTVNETSHAFALPAALRPQLGDFDLRAIDAELGRLQAEIDDIAFELYGFSVADRSAANQAPGSEPTDSTEAATDDDDDEAEIDAPVASTDTLLSWAVGVAFGRFDLRLATDERAAPPEPEPFDPLPALSPGMLPVSATPFHAHGGILVDDPGHTHDLASLVDGVLVRVKQSVPDDLRRWLRREFFAFHLQRYSKSRRRAPIYWPLATVSGSYTLWLYYPSLSSQTLFTAINDFIDGPDGKLTQVAADVRSLRNNGATRSRDEEMRLENLEALRLELMELRDTLLKIATTYKPNHDDGVQITAAPLWPLFRHKPWQKVLKDTWAKLEKGDYDWAHLAMAYWPDRVREKCKTDKSLAIAHCLEHLYVEPEAAPKKARGRKKADT
jgi:hypothetical protein